MLDDTLLLVWQRGQTFNGQSKVFTWIFGIAYRKAMKALSRLDEPPDRAEALLEDEAAAPRDGLEQRLDGRLVDPDYAAGLAAWKAHDGPEVVQRMGVVIERQPRLADAGNYRAHAYRQLGRLEQALQHCERALAIDPRHRGAHEYLGEAYLLAGRLADAEAELRQLDRLCWLPCEEYRDLKEQISRYKLLAGRSGAAASAVAC